MFRHRRLTRAFDHRNGAFFRWGPAVYRRGAASAATSSVRQGGFLTRWGYLAADPIDVYRGLRGRLCQRMCYSSKHSTKSDQVMER